MLLVPSFRDAAGTGSVLSRRRLDTELVRRRLVVSREQAQTHIADGRVLVAGAPAAKPSRMVAPDEAVVILGDPPRFVGRGGQKLEAALDRFGVDPRGRRAVDAGASTGGFTDCLLQRGAAQVLAVDVGHGQLHERLRADPRVVVIERTNIRTFVADSAVDLLVADLSFISLATAAPGLVGDGVVPGADVVVLVKPQFEAGRVEASRGRGVITDPVIWARVLDDVRSAFGRHGAVTVDAMVSPLRGAEGNVEFLFYLRAHGDLQRDLDAPVDLTAVVAAAAAVVPPCGLG